jgi:hypothetical protein
MHIPRSIRKLLLGFAVVLVIAIAAFIRFHHPKPVLGVAYAGGKQVILWDSSAEIREPIGTLKYGDRLDVLDHFQERTKVRTAAGQIGWVSEYELLTVDLWQKMRDLEATAAASAVEARGETDRISNLHIAPGRETPRVRQLGKGIPVDLFERQPVDAPQPSAKMKPASAPAAAPGDDADAAAPAAVKKEDWWLARAKLADGSTATGWVLGRFVDLDLPAPLPDYASSAGIRAAAFFELNSVPDDQGQPKPQYLLVGIKGPEGQPCDFTQARVFTWGKVRARYETAFVASDLCGKLPIKITHLGGANGDPGFTFTDLSDGSGGPRVYQMHQTVVRRVKQPGDAPAKSARATKPEKKPEKKKEKRKRGK